MSVPEPVRLAAALIIAAIDEDADAVAALVRWAEPAELAEAAAWLARWLAKCSTDPAGFRAALAAQLQGDGAAGAVAAPHPWPSRPPPSSHG